MSRPYTAEELALGSPDERVAARLGVVTPNADRLSQEIFDDLDPEQFGVGWWHPDVDVQRSILLGDHIHLAANALSGCLVEARVHELELLECWDRQDARWRAHLLGGGEVHKFPPPHSPSDELPFVVDDVHVSGFFRAIAHALDCLAAVVIGVGDLPLDVHGASWPAILRRMSNADDVSPFEDSISAAVAASGPAHWVDWTLAMRNMLVHRPRIVGFASIGVVGSQLVVPGSSAQERVHVSHLLPRTPTGSAIEGMVASARFGSQLLSEDAVITIERLRRSASSLVESVAELARAEWTGRRTHSLIQRHVVAQWPRIGTPIHPFEGFAPGSLGRSTPDTMMGHDRLGHRLGAAGLLDNDRPAIWGD